MNFAHHKMAGFYPHIWNNKHDKGNEIYTQDVYLQALKNMAES